MTAEADDDEYVVSYTHRGKKLHSVYWTHEDNRARALRGAQETAQADGVSGVRVFRRPKVEWEPLDWRPIA